MTSVLQRAAGLSDDHARTTGRLVVTIRRPSGSYESVGILDAAPERYRFAYLRRAVEGAEFVPLLGFRDAERTYERPYLFPLFAERVISPRRPDRMQYLDALNLDADATPLEVLTRSGGHRGGDAIELVPVPRVDPQGRTQTFFMVHGVRYRDAAASNRIARLERGHTLRLVPEPENVKDPRAITVRDLDGLHLGYVPAPLTGYIHALATHEVAVEVANGPAVNPHLRLLVELRGTLTSGAEPFDGPEWETVGSLD